MSAVHPVDASAPVTPIRVTITLAALFGSELFAMALLELVPGWPAAARALVDAGILLALALPVFLVAMVRPLVVEVRQRREAEASLREAQAALRHSEELHRVTLSNINEAVFLLDEAGAFVFLCPNVATVFGFGREAALQRGTIHELLRPGLFDPEKVAAEGEINDLLCRFERADGQRRMGLVNFRRVEIAGAVALCTCRDVTDHFNAREAERAAHGRLKELARRLVGAQEAERERIARELHDEASQGLTGLKLALKVLESRQGSGEELRTRCEELRTMADDVHESLHRLAVSLRPAALTHLGLEGAIAEHVESIRKSSGLAVGFKAVGDVADGTDPSIEIAVYRFVQEAVTNVIRHAEATRVDIVLERHNGTLLALVEDDGRGLGPAAANGTKGLGIAGMRERAEMLGGSLRLESGGGKGLAVAMELPVS